GDLRTDIENAQLLTTRPRHQPRRALSSHASRRPRLARPRVKGQPHVSELVDHPTGKSQFSAHPCTSPVPPQEAQARCPVVEDDSSTVANAASMRDVTRFQPCPRHDAQRLSGLLRTVASPLFNHGPFPHTDDMS